MANSEKHWVIELDNEEQQIAAMVRHWKRRSIYRLPASLTDRYKESYEPQIVSFGPYHHGKVHLRPMEEHKHRALLTFLKRSNRPLQVYKESLAPMVQELKDAYDSLDDPWEKSTDEEFLMLMILDGCFMLEILHILKGSHLDDYVSSDRFFSYHGKVYSIPFIKCDMLMIENQLPMVLLHKMLAVQNGREMHEEQEHVKELILTCFSHNPNIPASSMGKCHHVLDLYKKMVFPEDHQPLQEGRVIEIGDRWSIKIKSAVELYEAGIQFKPSKFMNLKDISFDDGVLKLPSVMVLSATKSIFLNLIAFERFHVGAGNEVNSYIYLMDNLINSSKDVKLLISEGILCNALGTYEDVANVFNSISTEIMLEKNNNLDVIRTNLYKYSEKPWNAWRAYLIQTYFTNPWTAFALVAAFLLFALSVIQTIYTVYSCYK